MRWQAWCIGILVCGVFGLLPAADDLLVYPPVPGLAPSSHYTMRVRVAGRDKPWQPAFAWVTSCKSGEKKEDLESYFKHLAGWSNTYINFEMNGAVEVEIARVDGKPIRSAVAHPRRHAQSATVVNGKALITLPKPCQVAVDIDGQMDGQDTGMGYKGPPIHTVTIFANPPIVGRPQPNDPDVWAVKPGEKPPTDGPWKTLYFLPGIHEIGAAFQVNANRQYYIPGDAVVFGTFKNQDAKNGHHIRIFGYGTLSGERLKHPKYAKPAPKEATDHNPIHIFGANDTSIEGITIADSAHHSLMLFAKPDPQRPTDVRWVKIFTWRANGDGINPFLNTLIEDCFIRTQDDSCYTSGRGMRRTIYWNDANGTAFLMTSLPNKAEKPLIIEDCDVIYARAAWNRWAGGRVFSQRGEGKGACGAGVIFRNITIEDPRPTLQVFMIATEIPAVYGDPKERNRSGDMSGILFQNISIAALSVKGEPEMIWGHKDGRIHHITFDNLTVAGKRVESASFFKTNEFVSDLIFTPAKTVQAVPPVTVK